MWRNVATWSAILVLLWISKTLKTVRVIEHRLMPLASGQWGARVDKTDQWGVWWLVWHTGPGLLGMGWVRSCDFYRPVSLSLSDCLACSLWWVSSQHFLLADNTVTVTPWAPETPRSWSSSLTFASSVSRCRARAASRGWRPGRTRWGLTSAHIATDDNNVILRNNDLSAHNFC